MRAAAPALSFAAVVLGATGALAERTSIRNEAGTILSYYDNDVWIAARSGPVLNYVCKAAACGGESALCNIGETGPEGGETDRNYLADLKARLDGDVVGKFQTEFPGSSPEIAETAAERFLGPSYGVGASVRASVDGGTNRYSFFFIDTVYLVVVVTCQAPEDRYETARASFDALTASLVMLRPAQPDP